MTTSGMAYATMLMFNNIGFRTQKQGVEVMDKQSTAMSHVLMCGDSGYFQHIAACLVSLLETNPETHFNVVILATKSTEADNEKMLRTFKSQKNISLSVQRFDASLLADLPLGPGSYPPDIYARFWIEHYFGPEVERVLYLDGDMVILGSVGPLLEMDLGANVLAAVQIPGSIGPRRLGYDAKYGYFNSGVMVINLRRWRELGAKALLVTAAHEISEKLNDPDQDVLNYCFHDKCIPLDYIWNTISPFFKQMNYLNLSQAEIAKTVRNTRIVHFNGPGKPWHYVCFHPYAASYLRSVAKTEWRDVVPKDYTLINIVKKRVISLLGERRSAAVSDMIHKYRK